MRKDNELLQYVNELEKRDRAKKVWAVSVTSLIVGFFSGAIAAALMILIFK